MRNITIPLSKDERKHLILIGKNGSSGKTSVLQDLKSCLMAESVKPEVKMRPFPKEKVTITALKRDEMVASTVRLLMEIYNGTTPLKEIEAANIRKRLLKEILDFQQQLMEYFDENAEDDEKKHCEKKIKEHLKKSSAFTAFKRWIIKGNPSLREEFKYYFD